MFAASRHMRRPKHNFFVEPEFWEIQPILLAPVLPGESLKRLTIQSRVVTPPLKAKTVGLWLEYYFFYVPFRMMPDSDSLVAMFVDPSATLSTSAAQAYSYYDGRGYNFITQCLQAVVTEWFRRDGELWSTYTIRANRPAASTGIDTLGDSLIDATVLTDGGAIAGMNVDELDRARMVLEYRRQLRLSGAGGGPSDYEEIVASYGASLRLAKERDRPELIRYLRQWTYPTNTVEPTTGVPTTAASWAVSDRATKRRAFNEPGFIFGVQCIRPKLYHANQTGHGSSMLDRAQRWLPPVMDETGMERSLAEFTNAQGPYGKSAGGFTNGYWLDVLDLFNYGDQYIDYQTAANGNSIALPTTAQVIRYGTEALADTFLVTASTQSQCDGNVSLEIATRHVDPS